MIYHGLKVNVFDTALSKKKNVYLVQLLVADQFFNYIEQHSSNICKII